MARDNAWEDQRSPIGGDPSQGYYNTDAEYRRKGLEPPSQEGLEVVETPNWLGRMFGMKTRRFDYTTGDELGDGQTGIGGRGGAQQGLRPPDHPYAGPPRGMCDECGQPEMAHDEDEEEARGPGGPKMPRLVDVPNYTVWGRLLKHFGR